MERKEGKILIVDLACGWLKFPSVVDHYPDGKLPEGFDFPDAEVIGLDVNHYNNEIVASVLAVPLRTGIADIVVMRQIIEHLDASKLLREAWRLLKKNGKILVETPNAHFIFSLLRSLRRNIYITHSEHIQTFTGAELINLLRQNGFEKTELSWYNLEISHPKLLVSLVKKIIAHISSSISPMFCRDIRALAFKNAEAEFFDYRNYERREKK